MSLPSRYPNKRNPDLPRPPKDVLEDPSSEFPPIKEAKSPGIARYPRNPPNHSRPPSEASSSSEESPSPSQPRRHRQPNTGLGQQHITDTVGGRPGTATVRQYARFAGCYANHGHNRQRARSYRPKSSRKRSLEMCDVTDEHSSKRHRGLKENDMDWLKGEIGSIKESLREIFARAKEDSRHVDYLLNEIIHKVKG